jgi:hypothetical protein
MPWVELDTGVPELILRTDGVLEWNTALQRALGDPQWVDLMWDATERWLGVRGVSAATGLSVSAEPRTGEYRIDSAAALAAVGVSVAENLAAEPDSWVQDEAGAGWAEWFGYNPIYYIVIPE